MTAFYLICPHCHYNGNTLYSDDTCDNILLSRKFQDIFNIWCKNCNKICDISSDINYFSLFNFNVIFDIDPAKLEKTYYDYLKLFHPDKFILNSSQEREVAIHNSSIINLAYQTLKNPMKRAEYILKLQGYDINHEKSVEIPQDILLQVMEWQSELEAAANDKKKYQEILKCIFLVKKQYLAEFKNAIEKMLYKNAFEYQMKLSFIERFLTQTKQNCG